MTTNLGVFPRLVALAVLLLGLPARAEDGDRLRVTADVPKGDYYVGQGIDVLVRAVADGGPASVATPKVDGAELTRSDDPEGVRFRVTPTRPGRLTIPPFVARLGGRSGASGPIRLKVRPTPIEGRPASYLGGVGPIEARAEVAPRAVRAGRAFEYRLVLKGPGARASTRWPILPEFAKVEGLSLEPAGTDAVADPPSRAFRFRVRASVPGDLTLPSVAVATFDPSMGRYVEARAPSAAVHVEAVPRFEPPGPMPTPDPEADWRPWVAAGAGTVATMAALATALARRGSPARRAARRSARALATSSEADVAGRVASGLGDYLARATGGPVGALTPIEAARGVALAVGDDELARRARDLIERSDRARFGGAEGSAPGLAAEASAFFGELARRRARG